MDDITVKVLDTLYDLCDGENFVILDEEDLTSRLDFYAFKPDEITEILEALDANGLIDLKYADEKEYCVAMRTKGRSLIKQARDRFQKETEAVEPEPVETPSTGSYTVSDTPAEQEAPRPQKRTIGLADLQDSFLDTTGFSSEPLRQQKPPVPRREEEEKKPIDWKPLLPAFLGAALGALLINVIFLVVFLMKFGG